MSKAFVYFIGPIVHPIFIVISFVVGIGICVTLAKRWKVKVRDLLLLPFSFLLAIPLVLLVMQVTNVREQTDITFLPDASLNGTWSIIGHGNKSEVDRFIKEPAPPQVGFSSITFYEDGTTDSNWFNKWSKGSIVSEGLKVVCPYEIIHAGEKQYLIFAAKSGDYAFFHRKPSFFILKKEST